MFEIAQYVGKVILETFFLKKGKLLNPGHPEKDKKVTYSNSSFKL